MKAPASRSTVVFGLSALLFSCAALAFEYWPSSSLVHWLSVDDAIALGRQTGKQVYIDVYADWCVPCRRMDREVFRDDSVLSIFQGNVIPARVDLDSELGSRLKKEFSIKAIPTSLLLNARGQEAKRNVGAMSAEGFLRWLRSSHNFVFASWQPYMYARTTAEESGKNLLVLVIKDKSLFEPLDNALSKESVEAFIGANFVPALLVESVPADKNIIDGFGGSVVSEHTAGTIMIFKKGTDEVARVPLTMRMLFSEMEFVRAVEPYASSATGKARAPR